MKIVEWTGRLREGWQIGADDSGEVLEELMDEEVDIGLRADFLEALHERGETPGEIAALAAELLAHSVPFPGDSHEAVDVCGTGGDRAGFFNISTAVMFVCAALGLRVAKHGNRAITSKSGGADVLEELGIRIDCEPVRAAEILGEVGCVFLFAPAYHPAVGRVAPVRRELARRGRASIFNLLGPLLNPARPDYQLVGLFEPALLETYAQALHSLGRKAAWVVHGTGPDNSGLDEISTLGPTSVAHFNQSSVISTTSINPSSLGLESPPAECLRTRSAGESAELISDLLAGAAPPAPTHIVALNAAAAATISGLQPDLATALPVALQCIADGAPRRILEKYRSMVPR